MKLPSIISLTIEVRRINAVTPKQAGQVRHVASDRLSSQQSDNLAHASRLMGGGFQRFFCVFLDHVAINLYLHDLRVCEFRHIRLGTARKIIRTPAQECQEGSKAGTYSALKNESRMR
jgi:hypothetical protein